MLPRRTPLRLCRALLMLACLLNGMGAHWVVLQSVAWAKMTASRLGSDHLRAVIAQVISGRSPCHICVLVEKGTQQEEKQPAMLEVRAVTLAFQPLPELPSRPISSTTHPPLLAKESSRPSSPRVPPPKTLPA